MTIAPWKCAFKSTGDDWIRVVTGSAASVVISVLEIVPIGKKWPWLPWVTFVIIWSWTWAWAFVKSWNREHRNFFVLAREFVFPQLEQARRKAGSNLTFSSEDSELAFYVDSLSAESRGMTKELVQEIIGLSKNHKPIAGSR